MTNLNIDKAYAGIDVAFAKKKRLPVVVCRWRDHSLEPLYLRTARAKPPVGEGNARAIEETVVERFAEKTVDYLQAIESEFGVLIQRVAIDAPSDPRAAGMSRRQAELELDRRRINCITTPDVDGFDAIRERARAHLAAGGPESHLPGANQLWMLVGFSLFRSLRRHWECLEVFPQAIAAVLGARMVHKSQLDGLVAQLTAAAQHCGWPSPAAVARLGPIGYGSSHDRLDAFLAAWVASLNETERVALGVPPNDVIWVPRLASDNHSR
jgi:hypothetical protein